MNWRTLILFGLLLPGLHGASDPPTPPPGMVYVPGGEFEMGSTDGEPDERPVHTVQVDAFFMDEHEVTNAQFRAFVEATGYATEAERWGWSLVFAPDDREGQRVPGAEWWLKVDGADWRHPRGPESMIEGRDAYPVVQVSWNDAAAYATWAGKRLPTEAEWEFAARAGSAGQHPWGDGPVAEHANTWLGEFPDDPVDADGFVGLAPVKQYPPNALGLYDIAGNVWEWCGDWYHAAYYANGPESNPRGPESGVEKVMRGGSWLCSPSYCHGFRITHRNRSTPDSGLDNIGFRCAADVLTASD